jgi:FMN phosphatase YigB (HAD superfamily)
MIKAILFDMDDTLLINPDDIFAREYLALAEPFFQQMLDIQNPRELLLGVVKAQGKIRSGQQSNFQLIYEHFQHYTTHSLEKIQHTLALFFEQEYPKLEKCITPVTGASELIQYVQAQGFATVIATNPLYPDTSIFQRMRWGKLPLEGYALITHANNMHFAKPDPAYYAEIVARVGIEPDEALMIGDNPINDTQAAKAVGLPTWQIEGRQSSLEGILEQLKLPDFVNSFAIPSLSPEIVLNELRGNMGAIHGLLEGVTFNLWHLRPDPSEWSILQIMTHLATTEETIQHARLLRILREDNPFITAPKPPGASIQPLETLEQALTLFVTQRQKTFNFLQEQSELVWQRSARHSVFGNTTFLELAHFTAQHDRIHINQLCQTIGRCQVEVF